MVTNFAWGQTIKMTYTNFPECHGIIHTVLMLVLLNYCFIVRIIIISLNRVFTIKYLFCRCAGGRTAAGSPLSGGGGASAGPAAGPE